MRPHQAPLAALLLVLAATGCSAQTFSEPDVEVLGSIDVTYSGYKFEGQVINITSFTGVHKVVHRFRRVPYAEPPTGDRRFARPHPLDFSKATNVDAKNQAPLCPQDNSTKGLPYEEDCLFFNIWSPDVNTATKYPVLVFIHGGRFETGGIAEPENQGETFLRNQNVVLVTINYRLGSTGFLYLNDSEIPGNFGLLDQRLALRTIQNLASAFGGDPNRITLAGHGTGAASVGFHITTASINVTRAVLMGGSVFMPLVWSNEKDRVRELSEQFVNIQLDCARGPLEKVIECLRHNVSIETIIKQQRDFQTVHSTLEFMPVLDREFFNLHDPLAEWGDRRKAVKILMGVSSDSGSEFVDNSLRSRNLTIEVLNRTVYYGILERQFEFYPRFPSKLDETGLKFLQLSHTEWNDVHDKELLRTLWSRALGDFSFLCPTLYALFDDGRPNPGDDMNTYLYYFNAPDHNREDTAPGHENDLRYFLGIPDGPGIPYPADHNELSKRMMADLAGFVTDGKPNEHWSSVIAGNWNFNNYILNNLTTLYNVTGGFAIKRCRWWHETLSFVNRLESSTLAKSSLPSYLKSDPFKLDLPVAVEGAKQVQQKVKTLSLPNSSNVTGTVTVTLASVNAKITGDELTTMDGKRVDRFLGIPYAQPPMGERRFALPVIFPLNGS